MDNWYAEHVLRKYNKKEKNIFGQPWFWFGCILCFLLGWVWKGFN